MCLEISQLIRKDFPGRTLSGLGGVETGADAAQFILLGSDTVQVCTGVMKFGYGMVRPLCEELLRFMEAKESAMVRNDAEWDGDDFVKLSNELSR